MARVSRWPYYVAGSAGLFLIVGGAAKIFVLGSVLVAIGLMIGGVAVYEVSYRLAKRTPRSAG